MHYSRQAGSKAYLPATALNCETQKQKSLEISIYENKETYAVILSEVKNHCLEYRALQEFSSLRSG